MEDISILLAFSAGLLSFLSPCVLPLIPSYISYLTGYTIQELKENKGKLMILYRSVGFVIGFSIVFILMGASISALGKLFIVHRGLFRKIGGILIILFGIHITELFPIKLLYREKRYGRFDAVKGPIGSVVMGIAFAAGWTPCVGPILSSILIYAANENSVGKGILLLYFYSLGMAVPFLLTAMAINDYHFRVLIDKDGAVAAKYNISLIPTSYFIDKDGNVISVNTGAMTIDEMKQYISELE